MTHSILGEESEYVLESPLLEVGIGSGRRISIVIVQPHSLGKRPRECETARNGLGVRAGRAIKRRAEGGERVDRLLPCLDEGFHVECAVADDREDELLEICTARRAGGAVARRAVGAAARMLAPAPHQVMEEDARLH